MWNVIQDDPIAVYGAVLSTIIAVVGMVKWFTSGPRASIEIINPLAVARVDKRAIEVIISNVGSVPAVVRECKVTFHKAKSSKSLFKEVRFNHGWRSWDPSLRSVPHPTKPDTNILEVEVIPPGHEIHQVLNPPKEYDPKKHWLKASATFRNSRRIAIGWAPPIELEVA